MTRRIPRPHRIRPADWQRMSWHQQHRAWRNWLDVLALEEVKPEPTPVPTRPDELALQAFRKIVGLLERELVHATQAARRARLPEVECGTLTAYRRHVRYREPLDEACRRVGSAKRAADKRAARARARDMEPAA